jgi:hypothetical protein
MTEEEFDAFFPGLPFCAEIPRGWKRNFAEPPLSASRFGDAITPISNANSLHLQPSCFWGISVERSAPAPPIPGFAGLIFNLGSAVRDGPARYRAVDGRAHSMPTEVKLHRKAGRKSGANFGVAKWEEFAH